MAIMDAYDRWQALKSGEKPDRPPISFWRHFYDQENSPETFSDAMIGFQRRFDWDLVKINPKGSYHIEPWGVMVKQSQTPLDMVNWDATDPTNLSLRDSWKALNKPIMGGIDRRRDLLDLPQDTLTDKTRKLVQAHADLPFAVGPGHGAGKRLTGKPRSSQEHGN